MVVKWVSGSMFNSSAHSTLILDFRQPIKDRFQVGRLSTVSKRLISVRTYNLVYLCVKLFLENLNSSSSSYSLHLTSTYNYEMTIMQRIVSSLDFIFSNMVNVGNNFRMEEEAFSIFSFLAKACRCNFYRLEAINKKRQIV